MKLTPGDTATTNTTTSSKIVEESPQKTRLLFGTDGVRGVANSELTPETALALGAAAASVLSEHQPGRRSRVVLGRDPRISGDLLGAALMAGLCSQGVDVLDIGVVPTPGVAFVTRTESAVAGVVISASHNPLADNGIKFFGPDGKKLGDAVEARIEHGMAEVNRASRPSGGGVGRIIREHSFVSSYTDHLIETCGATRFDGLRLVVDCANGSASYIAKAVLESLGAKVHTLSSEPDGLNINKDCGSLHPELMASEVLRLGCDAGLAFDGDADRVILADELGRIFDGDRILCTVGIFLHSLGSLTGDVVVGTVMSNIGLEKALGGYGIALLRAAVGDRYVGEMMRSHGASIGGEKSGHILFTDLTTTGDGLLTALQLLKISRDSARPLSSWADEMLEFPQRLVNIRVREREGWESVSEIASALRAAEIQLEGKGRIFVRPSGTEKMIRVMAEGPDATEVDALVGSVAAAVQATIGL